MRASTRRTSVASCSTRLQMREGWRGGLVQLLESMAHADQLDPLDVEGTCRAPRRSRGRCG